MKRYEVFDANTLGCLYDVAWQHGNHAAIEYKYTCWFLRDRYTKKLIRVVEVHGDHMWRSEKAREMTHDFAETPCEKWYSN